MNVNVTTKRLSMLQILEPSGGGSGRHFLDLCRAMQHRGHSVTAIYSPLRAEPAFVAELEGMGLDAVHSVGMKRALGPADLTAWLEIRRIIAKHGPFDLIHGHSSKAGALARLRVPGARTPVIYTPHAFRTMDPTLRPKQRLAFGTIERVLGTFFSNSLICVSRDEYDHAVSIGIPKRRLRVVYNGVARPPVGEREAIRARFGIGEHDVLYGFVGRLSAQKAPERLVDAFIGVAARQPNARLLMIGSGELEQAVRQRIADAGLSHRAHLDSSIPGPVAIDAFDIVVMPSRYEAMSYVMLEAASGGKPLILTDVGGVSTVLEHGRNGLKIANSDDPSELTAAMLAAGEPETLATYAAEAHRRRNRYTLSGMADETEEIYFDLLGHKLPSLLRTPADALELRA
ncbi:glycosyltransferase family 4 protein [Rhizobium sp. HT1-10]|uniref:glycosyltransferase family 4 protein n=1 Tax=Rhizobium sp. HT1-10 TaxID=3111638 RepID=UPI003C25FA37